MRGHLPVLLALLTCSCKPATTRPFFPPVTGAAQVEIDLAVRSATGALADVLRSDSFPVTRVVPLDGFIETAWFDAGTRKATRARRLGPEVVQVRAWVDPTRPGHSRLTVETVYRPLADPSRSPRDLERQVPPDHQIGKRMTEIVTQLAKLYESAPGPGATQ
jgi:hypothetical protein